MSDARVAGRARSVEPAIRQAAAWFARLRADDVTGADRTAFERWLQEDLENRAAYEQFERFWSKTGEYAGERAVVRMVWNLNRPRRPLLWAAAASVLLAIVGVALAPRLSSPNGVHETRVGERNTMTLRDGSRITLNTDTRVRVTYSEQRRLVELSHGQAYFSVVKDPARPFEVLTRNGSVRALGTEFDVYQQGQRVLVTLIEGKVIVKEARSDGAPGEIEDGKVLQPGELIALQPGRVAEVRRTPIEHSKAWLEGKLVFDDAPLEYAVAECNRYSNRKIAFGDDELKSLRISGVFRAGEPEEFVHAISAYFPVKTRQQDRGSYILIAAE